MRICEKIVLFLNIGKENLVKKKKKFAQKSNFIASFTSKSARDFIVVLYWRDEIL